MVQHEDLGLLLSIGKGGKEMGREREEEKKRKPVHVLAFALTVTRRSSLTNTSMSHLREICEDIKIHLILL